MRFLKVFSFLAFVIVFSCKEDEKKTVVQTKAKIEEARSIKQPALFSYLDSSQATSSAINIGAAVVGTGICGVIIAIPLMVSNSGLDDSSLIPK